MPALAAGILAAPEAAAIDRAFACPRLDLHSSALKRVVNELSKAFLAAPPPIDQDGRR